jgi:hypothetical protein
LLQAQCTPRRQSPTIRQQKVEMSDEHFDAVQLSGTFHNSRMTDCFELGRLKRLFMTGLFKGEHNIAQNCLKICIFGNMRSFCKTENKTVETVINIKNITQL